MRRSPFRIFQISCNYDEGMWCLCDPTRRICWALSCCMSDCVGWDVKMSGAAASPVCESVMWDDGGEAAQAKCGARSPVNSPIISGECGWCAFHCCPLWCFYIRKATALNTFFILRCILSVGTSQSIDLTHSLSTLSTRTERKRDVSIKQFVHVKA